MFLMTSKYILFTFSALTEKDKISDSEDFKATQMSTKQMRRAYLVTYGQADLKLFLTRESFSSRVVATLLARSHVV